jgi:hypothetical protein
MNAMGARKVLDSKAYKGEHDSINRDAIIPPTDFLEPGVSALTS